MRKSKKFIGMPIISLAEGQEMGAVKGLVVDPFQQRIAALIIEQKGWFKDQKFAPYGKVRSVGADAITIDQGAIVEKGTSLPDILKLYKERINIIGSKVIAENGSDLGEVDEFYVDEISGQIVGLEISGNFLNSLFKGKSFMEIAFVKTIGKELVVTSVDALENLVKVDGGLHETVKQLKDSTNHIWESTVQKTKEISTLTKEISSKKVEEIESKTKDLGETLRERVKRKSKDDPIEDDVVIHDLPAGTLRSEEEALNRQEVIHDEVVIQDLPPGSLPRQTEELTRVEQIEDLVEIHELPPGALPREENPSEDESEDEQEAIGEPIVPEENTEIKKE
ncbi:PRC-barrel domain-containing protein [Desulfotomaculum sp. 1211_IL3151]|uniref:PRC-barrel domain-containing protein n=1 Tax=Desulfotomaculum sp. 1211_IL3151 TaxID=3084055 RepID=UPI002FD92280